MPGVDQVSDEQVQVFKDIDIRYINALKEISPSSATLNETNVEEGTGNLSLKKIQNDIEAIKYVMDLESDEFPISLEDIKYVGMGKIALLFKYKKKLEDSKAKEFFSKAKMVTFSALESDLKTYLKSLVPEKEKTLEDIAIEDSELLLKEQFGTNKSKDVRLFIALYLLNLTPEDLASFVEKCREEKLKFKPSDARELSEEELSEIVVDI